MKKKLFLIFALAILLRFLYFPQNIYFGYDQARDAFEALDITKGNLKLIGPTTSFEGLRHGVAYYYLLAPFYLVGNGDIFLVSAILRIFNALGVFLIFIIAKVLFDKKVGFLASLLYAVSFEETQFSIYMGNPAPAVLSVMLMYLGLALVAFKNHKLGLPLAMLGFGFSVQFQFALLYLIIPLILITAIFKKKFLKLPLRVYTISLFTLLLSISTFLIAEVKFGFKTIEALLSLSHSGLEKNFGLMLNTYFFTIKRITQYNLSGDLFPSALSLVFLLALFIYMIYKKIQIKKIIFLAVWFFGIFSTLLISGGIEDLSSNTPLYYPNIGVSVSLIIFVSFTLGKLYSYHKFVFGVALVLFLVSNIVMVKNISPKGTMEEINVQQGMLLGDELKILNYTYQESGGGPFAVKAITMPYTINTTWSYLYEWYGMNKYGYLPLWNGKNAQGYRGNLEVVEAQEKLPSSRFLIIEPTRGIRQNLIDDYLKEENYFTNVTERKQFGMFIVEKRIKY